MPLIATLPHQVRMAVGPADRLLVVRVSAEVGATVGFLTALKYMPLANVTDPAGAATDRDPRRSFFGEFVGWRRWLAI